MEMNFCRRCGTKLSQTNAHVYTCENKHTIFANASPTVGVFFVSEDKKVLLSVRGIEPHKGMLDTFGGFLDDEENCEMAVERELKEELGILPNDYSKPEFITTAIGDYPFRGEILPVLTTFYWARLSGDIKITPQDDVADVVELDLHEIDYDKLHSRDIVEGLKALQAIFR